MNRSGPLLLLALITSGCLEDRCDDDQSLVEYICVPITDAGDAGDAGDASDAGDAGDAPEATP